MLHPRQKPQRCSSLAVRAARNDFWIKRAKLRGVQDLSNIEREQLRSWQRRLVIAFVVTIAGLLIVFAADIVFGFSPRGALLAFSALLVLALAAMVIQISQKCPRCGYRLGRQTRLLLPDRCKKCGVALK